MNKEELLKLEKEEIISILFAIIEQQAKKISELEARLNQNSKNSSKPPSSDGYSKAQPSSLRKPSGKKPGGQKGHEGSGFTQTGPPDQYVLHEPEACKQCPNYATCESSRHTMETRYEVDIQINTVTTAHQTLWVKCPENGSVLTGIFPERINSTMQYGVNLGALAVSLNTVGAVSINRIHEILSCVFGVPISVGTISSMVNNCAENVACTVETIKDTIIAEPLIQSDETGIRVDGKTMWAHTASTETFTYISVQPKRGQEGIDAAGVLPNYRGTVIHDCWAAYFLYAFLRHGLCNAHLLRELIAVQENTRQAWAQSLMDLLLGMKSTKEELLARGVLEAPASMKEIYSLGYDAIMAEALELNPVPAKDPAKKGKPKRGKTGALVDRLILRKEQYLLFFSDFSVPFDNNLSERDIRMFKVKQKVSGCFRTLTGIIQYANIMSYIGTARKQGIPAFWAIKEAMLGVPFGLV